jgi:hypothetical protein
MKTLSKIVVLGMVGFGGYAVAYSQGQAEFQVHECGRTLTASVRACSLSVPEPGGVLDKVRKPNGSNNGGATLLPTSKKDNQVQGDFEPPRGDCHSAALQEFLNCTGTGPVIINKKTGRTSGTVNTTAVTKKKED